MAKCGVVKPVGSGGSWDSPITFLPYGVGHLFHFFEDLFFFFWGGGGVGATIWCCMTCFV